MTLSIRDRLKSGEILVGDGAIGTMLLAEGLLPGTCLEKLNLEEPERLEKLTRSYLDAGAEIVLTNTFGGSPLRLALYGLAEQVEEINANAVRAARTAVGDRAYVCGSCGPSGRLLQPYGDTSPQTVLESFERQMAALVGAGAEIICIETMTDLTEAALAIEAARRVSPAIPVLASMTFDPTPQGFFTIMGVSIKQAALGLARAGADVIGSNCGNGIADMVRIASEFRNNTQLPLLIRPNAGPPRLVEGRPVYDDTPAIMDSGFHRLLELGVQVVGGCCGTTPEHISTLRRTADRFIEAQRTSLHAQT